MDLQGHMDELSLTYQDFAREAQLSYATIRMVIAGKPVLTSTADCIVDALSRKYGRTVEREEVEGLLLLEQRQV